MLFDIRIGAPTRVTATTLFEARDASLLPPLELFLGPPSVVTLESLKVDGRALAASEFTVAGGKVTLHAGSGAASPRFTLVAETAVRAEENSSLEGLYRSGGTFCTQCEAEGFRNVTPFLDRPDVMPVWRVRIEADAAACPVLLSNGNLVESGPCAAVEAGATRRHYAVWADPFPKPCYLFALVAGDLACTADSFTTASGRAVALRLYTAARDAGKTAWALASLKRAMAWDEAAYGREYDLDIFNIVAVADFNMGAMENKSLNIFNARLILASTETATDADFGRIEGVVAHEYFHNWTGNRVTCRDWFQLTLKEGLTVYRDQSFSADTNSAPVKRIEDVLRLRQSQFPEDAGPTAHAIRPDAVLKNDNLYSATVYEKGAEIIRMYATVLGAAGFRAGMDLYFARHDGQAVTCDDFYAAMRDANAGAPGVTDGSLEALRLWYAQAGTPTLTVTPSYDAAARTLSLKCTQTTPPTPGAPHKVPVLIPIAIGLLGPDGASLPLVVDGAPQPGPTAVLRLASASRTFVLSGVPPGAVPSILRGFSAPVRLLVPGQSRADLALLSAHDADPFSRWDAGQRLGAAAVLDLYDAIAVAGPGAGVTGGGGGFEDDALYEAAGGAAAVAPVAAAFRAVLAEAAAGRIDGAFAARALSLPAETELVESIAARGAGGADPLRVHAARAFVVRALAAALAPQLRAAVADSDAAIAAAEAAGGFSPAFEHAARRALRNKALGYLAALRRRGDGDAEDGAIAAELLARFTAASNMTDQLHLLAALVDQPPVCPQRAAALAAFEAQWAREPLVMLKWLGVQACAAERGTTAAVRALQGHAAFAFTNPNACYTLLGGFAAAATPAFHAADGSGYDLIADAVRTLDKVNPQVAARIVAPLARFRAYDAARRGLMLARLRALAAGPETLSDNVREIVAASLEAADAEAAAAAAGAPV